MTKDESSQATAARAYKTEPKIYEYSFPESVPAQELEDTCMLAMMAVESLHGRTRVREEVWFRLDAANRTCVIDASTDVGDALRRLFAGFAVMEYGEDAVNITCLDDPLGLFRVTAHYLQK